MTELSELPFYGLSDREFMKATGTWVYHSASLLTDSKDLFRSVVESPDKDDDLNVNTTQHFFEMSPQTLVLVAFAVGNVVIS